MAEGTAALRAAASHWSLAGDQQLLDILQNIHQRIISRCDETNKQLELMSRGLRDASINLQNVNNKFLALSNTQFVESRVYDDDVDTAAPHAANEEPPQLKDLSTDMSKLKQSLQILESYHEPLHILRDTDSDSDSDGGDDRLVLKPKDLYSDRPLPYIIGSQGWKSKWHAGLVQEDSDSDSSTSKVEEVEQYSESEEELEPPEPEHQPEGKGPIQESRSTWSIGSEAMAAPVAPERPSPSDVAAELARRLGGNIKTLEREVVPSDPDTVVRKLYKPQEPLTTTIFPDEPPPLDEASSDDDIFAELHKTHPKPHSSKVDDLFDFRPKTNDLENALFGRTQSVSGAKSVARPLFEDDLPPEQKSPDVEADAKEDNIKKPVGGISLFGTNKHAESIGAAILRRNRRKSSSGDESNAEEVTVVKEVKDVNEVRKEKDILHDLFTKSEKLNKKSTKNAVFEPKQEVKKEDVFSDIFDDIDDIFSTDIVNVPIKETKKSEKPLFSDDDDLFAEISKVKNDSQKEITKGSGKSGFIDDFKHKVERNVVKDNKNNVVQEKQKESKSLFDSDSDDGLFTNTTKDVLKEKVNVAQEPVVVEYNISDDIFGDIDGGEDLFSKNKPVLKEEATKTMKVSKTDEIKKIQFDSGDELLNKFKQTETQEKDRKTYNIFEEKDDILFVPEVNKPKTDLNAENHLNNSNEDLFKTKEKSEALKVIESINNDIFNAGDELYKKTESIKESINNDIFNDGNELFKKTESNSFSNKEQFPNNNSKLGQKITESVVQSTKETLIEDRGSDDAIEPHVRTENILRTTRIASDELNMQPDKNTNKENQNLFNDSDEELFKNTPSVLRNESKSSKKDIIAENQTENSDLFSNESTKADIFSDIFEDVPPIFEKPKEPKKSRNVNALFDDDSDDEALFFKKNDVITDEKPDISQTEGRFGIFNDEPPAIEVDFTQKTNRNDDGPQIDHEVANIADNVGESDYSSFMSDIIEDFAQETDKSVNTTMIKQNQDTTDNTAKEPKKVGKLKAMNFNINVNTLLPGASPKKKQTEVTDVHTASNEELHKTEKIEPKMVKSISFDDPEILDNKISKERAKIQVKRRPSTRRARKEAVRKSAIDLTDSSFDSSNDNSINESVKDKVVKTVYILNDDDIFGNKSKNSILATDSTKKHLNIVDSDEELFKKPEQKENASEFLNEIKNENDNLETEGRSFLESDDDDLFQSKNNPLEVTHDKDNGSKMEVQNERKLFIDSDLLVKQAETKDSSNTVDTIINKPNVISDEKVFSNTVTNITKEIKKVHEKKSFLDSDDSDDLFTTKNTKETAKSVVISNYSSDEEDLFGNVNKKGIETLGKVYESNKHVSASNVEKQSHSIFDEFPPNTNSKLENNDIRPKEIVKEIETSIEKPAVKKSILDVSSDEDDLFKTKTKLATKQGKSLFDDDAGENNDIFSPKTKEQKQDLPVAQASKEPKAAETVFVDPLSLFGDDELY